MAPAQSQYFDAWRGGAALVVLAGHGAQTYVNSPSPIWGAFAAAAVMAFFGLSGLLIGQSLRTRSWSEFARARVDRILPPFVLSLLLVLVLYWIAPLTFVTGDRALPPGSARSAFSLDSLLWTTLFLNGFFGPTLSANGPLWSLSFEVWYYAIAALVVYGRRWWAIFLGAALTVLEPTFGVLGIIWLSGCLLAWGKPLPFVWLLWAVPLALLAVVCAVPEEYANYALLAFELTFGLCFVGHLSKIMDREPPRIPLLPATAHFSYTLYVTHFPILLFCFGSGLPLLISILAALSFAWVFGRTVERFRPLRRARTPVAA